MNRIKIIHSLFQEAKKDEIIDKECFICYEEFSEDCFKKLSCKHELCKGCYSKLRDETCPFCRQVIKEKIIDLIEDPEEWLLYDREEWITYSRTFRNGKEIIYTYHNSDPLPSWRNDDNVIILKRNRQRKKRQRYNTQ